MTDVVLPNVILTEKCVNRPVQLDTFGERELEVEREV